MVQCCYYRTGFVLSRGQLRSFLTRSPVPPVQRWCAGWRCRAWGERTKCFPNVAHPSWMYVRISQGTSTHPHLTLFHTPTPHPAASPPIFHTPHLMARAIVRRVESDIFESLSTVGTSPTMVLDSCTPTLQKLLRISQKQGTRSTRFVHYISRWLQTVWITVVGGHVPGLICAYRASTQVRKGGQILDQFCLVTHPSIGMLRGLEYSVLTIGAQILYRL